MSRFFSGPREVVLPRIILVVASALLIILGMVMVYSASTIEAINEGASPQSYLVKQAIIGAFSILLAVGIAKFIPYYKLLDQILDWYCWFCLGLLLATLLFGTIGLGAKRWLVIGPIGIQPSEFAKAAIILACARTFYLTSDESFSTSAFTRQLLLFVFLPLALIFLGQSDLGTTMICGVGILTILFVHGITMRSFLIVLGFVVLFGVLAIVATGYRSDRLNFLNPEADYYGGGYQLVRSFYAFGEGGLFGVGIGNSTEKYLYLPEAETDFIFAIIGEELGLVGALFVIFCFLAILYAGIQIARCAPDKFGAMVASACTSMLVFQAFLNIACVLGLAPTTGKPLPFISAGGSALLGSLILVGLILSVSLSSGDQVYERRRDALRVVAHDDTTAARRGMRR